MTGFILEHPTRGTVVAIPGDQDDKFHFSWSNHRSDERNVVCQVLSNALRLRDQANEQVGGGVEVRRFGTWEVIAP